MNTSSDKYFRLRKEIDLISKNLTNQHLDHLQCKKGCDLCCMDYSIFPVEFFSIADELKNSGFISSPTLSPSSNKSCIFLKNHSCLIYESRPIICRTHGLPLLYTNDEGEWELSACELNFTEFKNDFTEKNTFPQDKFNSKLFLINKEFLQADKNLKMDEFELIPLKNIPDYF